MLILEDDVNRITRNPYAAKTEFDISMTSSQHRAVQNELDWLENE